MTPAQHALHLFLDLLADLSAVVAQTTDPDYIDEAGRIIGSPAAGPKPEHPGDRGGYAQLLTLLMLVLAMAFIAWRIQREWRRSAGNRTGG